MCIIIAKKANIPLPSNFDTIVNNCWFTNDDGGGLAIKRAKGKEIYISKGHMSLASLNLALRKADVKREDELIVHFRMATHGSRGPEMTHPFVVSSSNKDILTNEVFVKTPVVAHNGIFHGLNDPKHKLSDTYLFARDILGSYNEKAGNRVMNKWRKRFSKLIRNQRLSFMYPDKEMELMGSFVYHDGLFYSNHSFRNSYNYERSSCGFLPQNREEQRYLLHD